MSNLSEIDVLILCGGFGTRLRPTVGDSQKVMAKIDDRPFLDIILDYVMKEGFQHVVLCAGYKSESLEGYYKNKNSPLIIEFSKEEEPLGTGGAVKHARKFIQSNPFLVLNGDSFCPVRLKEFVGFHKNKKALASVVVSRVKDAGDFGAIDMESDDRITAFKEKTEKTLSYVNAGVYCFDRNVFHHIPQEDKFSMEKDFFPKLIGQGFFGYKTNKDFIDIGTPERYQAAKQLLRKAG